MGIFSRLKSRIKKRRSKSKLRSRGSSRNRKSKSPLKRLANRTRSALRKLKKKSRRKNKRSKFPKLKKRSRSRAKKSFLSRVLKKRKNKKSKNIFQRLKSSTGRALRKLKKVNSKPRKSRTILGAVISKIKSRQPKKLRMNKKRKEDVKGRRGIFDRIKSITKKLKTGIKQNYLLPVGFGVAKIASQRKDVFAKFFGGAKKKISSLVKLTPLFQLTSPDSTLRSNVGDWIADRRDDLADIKEKGIFDTVKDFFKGEGFSEGQRDRLIEEERVLSLEEEDRNKKIRNVAIAGGLGFLALIFLKKRK